MDYKKKYKEAVGKIKELLEEKKKKEMTNCLFEGELNEIFSELRESEDEKARKGIYNFLYNERHNIKQLTPYTDEFDRWLAWLEKQGEQKSVDKVNQFKIGDWIINNITGFVYIVKDKGYGGYIVANRENHKYTITTEEKDYRLWTIQDAKDGDVLVYRDEQWVFLYKDRLDDTTFRYYALVSEKGLMIDDAAYTALPVSITPATKEQRDTLMKSMADDGYEWDAEHKQLKKIEQKPAEWSEEDEEMFKTIANSLDRGLVERVWHTTIKEVIAWLINLKDRVQPQPKQEWDGGDEAHLHSLINHLEQWIERHPNTTGADIQGENIAWLKSLRPQMQWKAVDKEIYVKEPVLAQKKDKSDPFRGFVVCCDHMLIPNVYERYMILGNILSQNRWKPSEEQIKALEKECMAHSNYELCRLLEQLKKL